MTLYEALPPHDVHGGPRMTTYAEMKATFVDDRAPTRSACPHVWQLTLYGERRSRRVTCTLCGLRPHCAPTIFDSRQRSRHTHSQGETEREAFSKARFCYALSHGREQVEPVQCRHCGFWTIDDVKGERI